MNFSNAVVLVIGDVMLDRYVFGDVSRISPEAPIPILKVNQSEMRLGGAANVAANLRALGCQVILASVVGGLDGYGCELEKLCNRQGIIPLFYIDGGARQTTVKTRYVSGGHQILRTDEESTYDLDIVTEREFIDYLEPQIEQADVIILSDYAKGVLTHSLIQELIRLARGKPVVVDPKKPTFGSYLYATVITPNEKELFAGTNCTDLDLAAQKASDDSCASILVTRSEKGMSLFQPGQEPVHLPAHTKGVVDVSGAGDTVVAAVAACLAVGQPLAEAMVTANYAASVVVGKMGTATCSSSELLAAHHDDTSKVLSRPVAVDLVRAWKQQGLRIGFTNGCYDLLHPGHVNMLKKCRTKCDRLVVGLNSDDSVRRLKGPERPIQSEEARATVLSGLASVDYVVIFDEDTPLELISVLKPDILMKGADYTTETVVGSDIILNSGGQVVLIELDDGYSTTNLVRKLKSS